MSERKNGGRTTFSKVYLLRVVFGEPNWVWDVVPALQGRRHDHFWIRKLKQLQTLLLGTNINRSYSLVFDIGNSLGLRNRDWYR